MRTTTTRASEREALAAQLHDTVLQSLLAARYAVDFAERRAAGYDDVRAAVQAAIADARQLLNDLRRSAADEVALVPRGAA